MAQVTGAVETRIEWLEAPEVSTPELRATWARYEIWVGGRCVTQVEAPDGTLRRSVFGSLYPLAEWAAANWWTLTSHIRPSAIDVRYWTWPNVRTYPWLSQHNVRASGEGMAWPDLTLVTEGSLTRIHWAPDNDRGYARVRFASAGDTWVRSAEASEGLATLVDNVLIHLAEEGLPKTHLAEEWAAVTRADSEEREFCRTVARLGLDPYVVDDETADAVVAIAADLPDELAGDFFDSADPGALQQAADWTRRAVMAANRATAKAQLSLGPLYQAAAQPTAERSAIAWRPWETGYAMARRVREAVRIPSTERFDVSPWVGRATIGAPSAGIQGTVAVNQDRCGIALGRATRPPFAHARALGRLLAKPDQRSFILSAARGQEERVARAFAAELLAPAEGIREMLTVLERPDDAALEAIARRYQVSPLLVRHQYDNQIASVSNGMEW